MDENEFRAAYRDINEVRCVFEKGLNARRCVCRRARHFLLAGREGYQCASAPRQARCVAYLDLLRQQARFTVGVAQPDGPLPHNKELRIQIGGLQCLKRLLAEQSGEAGNELDVDRLLTAAADEYGAVEDIPFERLLSDIVAFQGRRRRGKT